MKRIGLVLSGGGARGFAHFGMARAMHEAGIPIDGIMGASAGSVVDRLVSFVDFAPTVLSLCGIEIPSVMQGTAFLGPVAGPARDYVYGARDRVDEVFDGWMALEAEGSRRRAPVGLDTDPANEVVATFFETDLPTVRLERGDRTVTAWLVPAGSGSKYEGQNLELWTKGAEATVTWLDEELKCKVKK